MYYAFMFTLIMPQSHDVHWESGDQHGPTGRAPIGVTSDDVTEFFEILVSDWLPRFLPSSSRFHQSPKFLRMASTSTSGPSCPVIFTSQTPYPLPSQKFMIPAAWKRFQLSQLINKALSLEKPVPFDFIINGEILRGTLGEWCAEHGVGEVSPLNDFLV